VTFYEPICGGQEHRAWAWISTANCTFGVTGNLLFEGRGKTSSDNAIKFHAGPAGRSAWDLLRGDKETVVGA